MTEITARRFAAATGRAPVNDDLERCNCGHAGEMGHWGCGWCTVCDKPRFECGHLLQNPPRGYTCPHCGAVSYNANDIRYSYCGACHRYAEEA